MHPWHSADFRFGDLVCWNDYSKSTVSSEPKTFVGIVYDFYPSNLYDKASYDIYIDNGKIVNLDARMIYAFKK